MSKKILITLLTLATLAMSTFASAATIRVPADNATIAAALAAAVAGDVISVAGGTTYTEDITLPAQASLTIKCSSLDSTFTITGAAGAGDVVTIPATASGVLGSPTTFQNVVFDISAATLKVAGNAVLTTATGTDYLKFYNCTFKGDATGVVTTDVIEINGAADEWIIENCTFTFGLAGTISNALSIKGAGAITNFDIIGNAFTGAGAGAIATDARALNVAATSTAFSQFYFGGNTADKAGIVLNFDSATGLPAYSEVRIYDNVFTRSLAFTFIDATLGGAGTDAWNTGQLLIKGNHFGSLTTEGDTYYAIMFDNAATADFAENNVHINNNNFQYPMTNGTDVPLWGGHVTANKTAGTLTGIDATANFWGQITGPLTAYEDGGIAVVKTTGAPYTYTSWINTYAVPQIDETNRGIEYYDYDNDGYLDRVVVWFDQYLDPAALTYAGWTIAAPYAFDTAKAPKLSIDNDSEGTPDGVFALTLYLVERTTMDTGVKPELTYARATGVLTGITGNINAKVNDVAAATATEHDKAKPVVKSMTTKDNGTSTGSVANNGKLDGLVVVFSENVALVSRTASNDTDIDNAFSFGAFGGYSLADGGTLANDTITLGIVEGAAANTSQTPATTITSNGSDDVADANANIINTVVYSSVADGAKPVAMIVETADFGSANTGTGSADGYIDGYTITFSENIAAIAAADSAKVRAGFTVVEKIENTVDLSTALLTVAATTMTVKGRSLKDASAVGHPWDTDATPDLTYIDGAGVKDAAGNTWTYFWDTVPAPDAAVTKMTNIGDKAKPIIARATGQVNSKNLYITFSEPTTGNGGGGAFAGADLQYHNIYNTGLNATVIASLSDADGSNSGITAVMDEIFLVADVVNDSLSIAAAVLDASANTNAMVDVIVTINDVIAPTLLTAVTKDYDNDGWIDTIKLTFSEDINDAGITGYNGTDKISLNATNWAAAGYTVVGLNFISTAAEQTTATTDAITRELTGVFDDYATFAGGVFTKKVIMPTGGDVSNDNILYLSVLEGSGADITNGDTDAVPELAITGEANAMVGDFKPNYLATVTKTPTDNAGAALMAAEFKSANDLTVWLSEAVADTVTMSGAGVPTIDQLVSGDFTIEVGTVGNTVSSTAKDVIQTSAGIVELFFKDAITTSENGGWIGLSGAGVLNDNAGYASTQTIGIAVGRKTIVAWEDSGTGGTTPPPAGPLTPASALTVTDIAGDNGHWFTAKFKVSPDTRVKSYQFYRLSVTGTDSTWIYTAVVPVGYIKADSTFSAVVPSPTNGSLKWAVVASSGDVVSDLLQAAKEGEVAIAQLAPAAKPAEGILTSGLSNIATGGAIDNIKPSNLKVYATDDNAGAGILVSWEAPADHGIVGSYGNGQYSFPIYGATGYQIFRRTGSEVFTLIGTATEGSTSYVDNVTDGTTVYSYRIKPTDGTNFAIQTSTMYGMANLNANIADFSSDGLVDFTDFTMFASVYGTTSSNPVGTWLSLYDMAPNGTVDFDDFTAFAANYGFGATKAAKEIAGVQLPVSNISITMDSKVDVATAMYFVNVNINDVAKIDGFNFKLAYDSANLTLDSVNGLVGLPLSTTKDGVIDVANMFNGEQFNGTVTLGFKSNGANSSYVFELTNAFVNDKEVGVSQITKLSSITAKATPQVYSLSKNYPNPFNPTTTIEYAIPSNGKVELVVYNMAGQKVRTMVNETKEAGFFKAVWDGRNDRGETVASGLYFYKLVSGKFNKIEKMTLVK